eukprot:15170164-Alexandrium_andersonii.AAC.1
MSASLVGSEMCIRDRRPTDVLVLQAEHIAEGLDAPPWDCATSRRCGPRTVSYTHLTLPTICSV